MSCNRLSAECACRLWSFPTERFVPVGDPSLLTLAEYCSQTGNSYYADKPIGYGYADYLVGETHGWQETRPDGSRGAYQCGGSRPGSNWEYVLSGRYPDVPPADRYRYRKLRCAVCRRLYVGWYRQDPVNVLVLDRTWADQPGYQLYDTSYWHAFNDEPAPADLADLREWTAEELATLIRTANAERDRAESPRYRNDCDQCGFLGQFESFDLYHCPISVFEAGTILARFGDEGAAYASMPIELIRMHAESLTKMASDSSTALLEGLRRHELRRRELTVRR